MARGSPPPGALDGCPRWGASWSTATRRTMGPPGSAGIIRSGRSSRPPDEGSPAAAELRSRLLERFSEVVQEPHVALLGEQVPRTDGDGDRPLHEPHRGE